jgi:hypothetical protein
VLIAFCEKKITEVWTYTDLVINESFLRCSKEREFGYPTLYAVYAEIQTFKSFVQDKLLFSVIKPLR